MSEKNPCFCHTCTQSRIHPMQRFAEEASEAFADSLSSAWGDLRAQLAASEEKLRVAREALEAAAEIICFEICGTEDVKHVQYHCNGCIRNRAALKAIGEGGG